MEDSVEFSPWETLPEFFEQFLAIGLEFNCSRNTDRYTDYSSPAGCGDQSRIRLLLLSGESQGLF